MKPKDLSSPYSWNDRKVIVRDRIWFVPQFFNDYTSFIFPGWDHPDFFGNRNPVYVEYCSGNGCWIAEKAQAHPEINWVAVEMKFPRVRKIWSKLKNSNLNNLFVICGEGHCVTRHYFTEQSVKKVFINFPDPWPKTRHAKHRVVRPDFIEELSRTLSPQGEIFLVTDDKDYSEEMIEVLDQTGNFQSLYPKPFFVNELEGYGTSYFEQLWREKGKKIRYHQYIKGSFE